jgi:dGTPase
MNVTHDKSIYTPAPATPQPLAKTLEEAKKKAEAMQHSEILQVLKKDFTPINFKTIIYPQAKRLFDELKTIATESEKATEIQNQLDKYKVTAKQYRIKSISHILETAKEIRGKFEKTERIIKILFEYYMENPKEMTIEVKDKEQTVIDYISGMTDIYAINKFKNIYLP